MKDTFYQDVLRFSELAGSTTDHFNVRQTALYIGLQCEELGEKFQAMIGNSETYPTDMLRLKNTFNALRDLSQSMKRGELDGVVESCDREAMLDADIDLAWVTIGSALSQGADVLGAMGEVARANLDKFPGGVVTKDANGKVVKPSGWRGPDLSPFVCKEKIDA